MDFIQGIFGERLPWTPLHHHQHQPCQSKVGDDDEVGEKEDGDKQADVDKEDELDNEEDGDNSSPFSLRV